MRKTKLRKPRDRKEFVGAGFTPPGRSVLSRSSRAPQRRAVQLPTNSPVEICPAAPTSAPQHAPRSGYRPFSAPARGCRSAARPRWAPKIRRTTTVSRALAHPSRLLHARLPSAASDRPKNISGTTFSIGRQFHSMLPVQIQMHARHHCPRQVRISARVLYLRGTRRVVMIVIR